VKPVARRVNRGLHRQRDFGGGERFVSPVEQLFKPRKGWTASPRLPEEPAKVMMLAEHFVAVGRRRVVLMRWTRPRAE
jgi:hypothetical protein